MRLAFSAPTYIYGLISCHFPLAYYAPATLFFLWFPNMANSFMLLDFCEYSTLFFFF